MTTRDTAEPSSWRHLGWPIAVAVLGTGGMLLGGVPAWRAAIIALSVGAALWTFVITVNLPPVRWPRDQPVRPYRHVTSWEVAGLSAARHSPQVFESHLRPRLWDLAGTLLQRRDIDPHSDKARELIGSRLYAVLTGADTEPRRVTAAIPALCQAIARLAASEDLPGVRPLRDPRLAGLAGRRPGWRRSEAAGGLPSGEAGVRRAHTVIRGQDGP